MESLQNVTWIFVGAGVILVSTAVLGGGIEVKEIKIPKLNTHVRFLAAILGVVFIVLPVILTELPIKPREENLIATPTKPENKEETGKTITAQEQPSEPKKSVEDDRKEGFIQLFNGKNLNGWETSGEAIWFVENGNLTGIQGANNSPGDLFTTNTYTDFILTFTYRTEWPCNSGLWFRYQSPQKAYQADILEYTDPVCYSGTLYCPGKMFLSMNEDKNIVDRDGWNTMKVRAEGDHLQIWMNDHKVADVHDNTTDSGKIGFQIHPGDQFDSMKIVVRELLLKPLEKIDSISKPRELAKDDRKEGFIQLFNGKNLNDWKANDDENAFTVRDSMIVFNGERSHLFYIGSVENANFRNFEFNADVMTEPGANGGIYFHTAYQETGWPSKGYEAQVYNAGNTQFKTGSLYGVKESMGSPTKDNEWFTLHIIVQDRHIVIKVNGTITVDYIEPEDFYDPDQPGRKLASGTFALQGFTPGSAVYYKNIMVKPLPSETSVSDTRREAKAFVSQWMSALTREDVETLVKLTPPPLFVNMNLLISEPDIREMYLGYYENDGPLHKHGPTSMDRTMSLTVREYIDLGHLEEDDPILSQMSLDNDDIVVTMIGHYEDGTEVRASFYFLRKDGHVKMAGFRRDFPPMNEAREYKEDFEDGKAQGWNLKWNSERQEGWRIVREGGNYMLSGTTRGAIRYAGRSWQDSRVRFQVRMEKGGKEGGCLHLSYRDSNESRYLINFQAERVQLEKIVRGTIYGNLAGSPPHMRHSYNTWYSVEVKGEGPRIRIYVNGELGVDYTDPEPLLSGHIIFWVGSGSAAQVDDVVVEALK